MKRERFVPKARKAEKYSDGNTYIKFFTYSEAKPEHIRMFIDGTLPEQQYAKNSMRFPYLCQKLCSNN